MGIGEHEVFDNDYLNDLPRSMGISAFRTLARAWLYLYPFSGRYSPAGLAAVLNRRFSTMTERTSRLMMSTGSHADS